MHDHDKDQNNRNHHDNPWQVPVHDEPTQTREYGGRASGWARLIVFLLGIFLLVGGLAIAFPSTGAIDPYLIRGMLILTIFGGAAAFWSRTSILRLARMAGIWILIILGISSFYLFQSDFGNRFMSALDPSAAISTTDGLIVHRSRDGHFWIRTQMNGVPVNMMVDTGASNIVLSPDDARRVGFDTRTLNFDGRALTANGEVKYARARATSVSIGDAAFYDVPVTINGADMNGSLMGMSVLSEFSSFEFRGDTLILRP